MGQGALPLNLPRRCSPCPAPMHARTNVYASVCCALTLVFLFCCRTVLSLLPPNVYQHVAAHQEHVPHLSPQVGIRQRPQASTGNARGGSPDRNARGGSPERDMIITANPWQLGVVCAARRSVSVFLSYICSHYVGIVCAMYAYPDRGQICSPPRQLSSRGPLGVLTTSWVQVKVSFLSSESQSESVSLNK